MNNINNQQQEQGENQHQKFETDTERLVREHLADPNHVITDEDLRKVRVGMSAPPDGPTQQAIEDGEDRIADRKSDKEDDVIPGAQKATPWDLTNS